jgi:glycosyltransferase involved in cell wall biosynthesis
MVLNQQLNIMKSSNLKNQPLISVIMNCYNGEEYLNSSIQSILQQTYKNWEIIFWDNQSIDGSAKIFKSYKDKRFKYFYADSHTSLYKARNLAIEKSEGEFISFLDTDDMWSKEKLALQIPYFENSQVGVVFSNLWVQSKGGKKKIYIKKKLPRGKIYNELINSYTVGILTCIIRKNFYLKLKKKFDDRFSIIGDFDLFLRLSKMYIFESIQKPLAFYRLHGKNLSILKKEIEIKEFETWLKENKLDLNEIQIKNLQKSIDYRKFINYKIDGKYKECINILFHSQISLFNIKNLIILFTPIIILKQLFWFYKD